MRCFKDLKVKVLLLYHSIHEGSLEVQTSNVSCTELNTYSDDLNVVEAAVDLGIEVD